jgi:hypothetical protein
MPLSCRAFFFLSHMCYQIRSDHRRFLRARKFDPTKAHKQLAATEAWRAKHDVLNLYSTFDPDELESARRFYPRWTGRRDKVGVNVFDIRQLDSDGSTPSQHGIPVYVFRLASLTGTLQKELNAVPEERRYQRMCVLCFLSLIPPTDAWP